MLKVSTAFTHQYCRYGGKEKHQSLVGRCWCFCEAQIVGLLTQFDSACISKRVLVLIDICPGEINEQSPKKQFTPLMFTKYYNFEQPKLFSQISCAYFGHIHKFLCSNIIPRKISERVKVWSNFINNKIDNNIT